jgi:hypothetical protein
VLISFALRQLWSNLASGERRLYPELAKADFGIPGRATGTADDMDAT